MNPIKYLLEKPAISSRMARWLMLLAEFDIMYVTQKAMKGRAISDYLTDYPVEEADVWISEFPDENILYIAQDNFRWQMFFNDTANKKRYGIGILLIAPDDSHTPIAIKLNFPCTNNMTKYEACTIGLKVARQKGIQCLHVYGDSALIIGQVLRRWKVKDEKLQPFHAHLEELASQFQYITFHYLPRAKNNLADALATLASMVDMSEGITMTPFQVQKQDKPTHCYHIELASTEDPELANCWYYDIWRLLKHGRYPEGSNKKDRATLRRLAAQYVICHKALLKRNFDGTHLHCITGDDIEKIMQKVYSGESGPHMNGHMLAKKIIRQGYYWTTMTQDCIAYVRRCLKCQQFSNVQYLPPRELYNMSSPWSFSTWGIDIIGIVTPKDSNGHEFILVAIDYFTKWVEAESYAVLNAKKVTKFIKKNIICRYGVPHELVSNNGLHFEAEVTEVVNEYGIQRHKSSPYRPQTNGAVEAANKNLKAILSKMTKSYQDWADIIRPLGLPDLSSNLYWGYPLLSSLRHGSCPTHGAGDTLAARHA